MRLRVELVVFPVRGIELESRLEVTPRKAVMERGHEFQAAGFVGLGQFTSDVALRPHLHRIPGRHSRIPHREVVMMHRHWAGELRPRPHKQVGPFLRVELCRGESWDDVFVTERVLVAECLLVPDEDGAIGQIHLPAIPLPALGRVFAADGNRSPMRVDAELRIAKPLRVLVRRQRSPLRLVRAGVHCRIPGRNAKNRQQSNRCEHRRTTAVQ